MVNFPAAALFVQSAIDVSTRYTVRVVNESNVPIESMVITGPGVRVDLGAIVPGQRALRHINFRGDGTLEFSAKQQEVQFGGQLEGYVTHGMGGDKTITVRRVGVYTINDLTD